MGWALIGRPTGPSPSAEAVEAAEVARELKCLRCNETAGLYSLCSCREDCGHRDCWRGPVQGRPDMPGLLHMTYPVPRFAPEDE